MSATAADLPRGPERFRTLWRLWRNERADPEPFYRLLAAYAVEDLDAHHGPLRGQTIADLGCGPGYYTYAFRGRGAEVIPIDNSTDELELGGAPPPGYVLGDAGALPLEDGSVDGVFCSNMLEHTPRPRRSSPRSSACSSPAAGPTSRGPTGTRRGAGT